MPKAGSNARKNKKIQQKTYNFDLQYKNINRTCWRKKPRANRKYNSQYREMVEMFVRWARNRNTHVLLWERPETKWKSKVMRPQSMRKKKTKTNVCKLNQECGQRGITDATQETMWETWTPHGDKRKLELCKITSDIHRTRTTWTCSPEGSPHLSTLTSTGKDDFSWWNAQHYTWNFTDRRIHIHFTFTYKKREREKGSTRRLTSKLKRATAFEWEFTHYSCTLTAVTEGASEKETRTCWDMIIVSRWTLSFLC